MKKWIFYICLNSGTDKLLAYPNPVTQGTPFTIEGVCKDDLVSVYNYLGVCVGSTIATNSAVKLMLDLPTGIYLIRANNKAVKIVVVR